MSFAITKVAQYNFIVLTVITTLLAYNTPTIDGLEGGFKRLFSANLA
jgi:hypothetical protein